MKIVVTLLMTILSVSAHAAPWTEETIRARLKDKIGEHLEKSVT